MEEEETPQREDRFSIIFYLVDLLFVAFLRVTRFQQAQPSVLDKE